jgi:hypothetical protein
MFVRGINMNTNNATRKIKLNKEQANLLAGNDEFVILI